MHAACSLPSIGSHPTPARGSSDELAGKSGITIAWSRAFLAMITCCEVFCLNLRNGTTEAIAKDLTQSGVGSLCLEVSHLVLGKLFCLLAQSQERLHLEHQRRPSLSGEFGSFPSKRFQVKVCRPLLNCSFNCLSASSRRFFDVRWPGLLSHYI